MYRVRGSGYSRARRALVGRPGRFLLERVLMGGFKRIVLFLFSLAGLFALAMLALPAFGIGEAEISAFLIGNIFFNKAPLHDGALIIRNERLYAAGCFLPLSTNPDIVKDLGTRHRAGIGMSENSDAVVLIVSEETGVISVAVDGVLKRGFSKKTLEAYLSDLLIDEQKSKPSARFRIFGRKRDDKPEE